jgi:hypothetical protein
VVRDGRFLRLSVRLAERPTVPPRD